MLKNSILLSSQFTEEKLYQLMHSKKDAAVQYLKKGSIFNLSTRLVQETAKKLQNYYYLTKSFFDCAEVWQNIIYHYSIFLSFQSEKECKIQQNKKQVLLFYTNKTSLT